MVKGYDPTTTDPSKIILEYLLRWSSSSNPLTLQQAQAYTKHWLKNSDSTAKVYQSFENLNIQSKRKPEIILRKSCRNFMNWSYWKLVLRSQQAGDQNYPAFSEDNRIIICLNHITNKTELKENLDRELTILSKSFQSLYKTHQNQSWEKSQKIQAQKQLENISLQTKVELKDKELIQNLYEGCRQGYKNYLLPKQAEQRVSIKCAKYLFLRRSQRQLPWDSKFRYANKIVEEII